MPGPAKEHKRSLFSRTGETREIVHPLVVTGTNARKIFRCVRPETEGGGRRDSDDGEVTESGVPGNDVMKIGLS